MMNFAFMQQPMNRYRFSLGSGVVISAALLSRPGFQNAGLVAAALTTVLGLVFAALLMWRYGKVESPVLLDGGIHPRNGLLASAATTARRAALHGAFYLVALLGCGWVLANGMPGDPDPFSRVASAALIIFVFTALPAELLSVLVVLRWGATPPRHVATGFLAIASLLGLVNGIIVAREILSYLGRVTRPEPEWELLMWVPMATVLMIVLTLWLRDIVVTRWESKISQQEERAKEAEHGRQLAEAQLAMLQAQIEPHFLYNTLASVQYLVRRDAEGADFMLTQLIRYLRHAVPKMRRPMSTLEQEFELADAFLQIARMRMGGRLTVKVELAEALHDIEFPPLVLQTLVENALKHGVEPKLGEVSITVCAGLEPENPNPESDEEPTRSTGRRLVVEVADNGVGLGRATTTAGSGAGLANIRQRLAGIYGDRASLTVADAPQYGVISRVVLMGVAG